MTTVLAGGATPRQFAAGTFNGYTTAINTGRIRFSIVPTLASSAYLSGDFRILISGQHGGIWLVGAGAGVARLQKFTTPGDATVYDQALTFSANPAPIFIDDDARTKTLTISGGATTGNGSFSYSTAGPYTDSADPLYVGKYLGGGGTFDFEGTISAVDDGSPDESWLPLVPVSPPVRAASVALLVAALVAPPVVSAPPPPAPPLSWAPTMPDYQLRAARAPVNVGGASMPSSVIPNPSAPVFSWAPVFPDAPRRARGVALVGGEAAPVATLPTPPAPVLSWRPTYPDVVARPRGPVNVGGQAGPEAVLPNALPPFAWLPSFPDSMSRPRAPHHASFISPPLAGGRPLTVGAGAIRQNILSQLAFSTPLTTFGTDLTFTANAATDTLTTAAHGMIVTAGPFFLTTTGTLPAGLDGVTPYYVAAPTSTTFKLALTAQLAKAGTAVDITDAGTGTHTLVRAINTAPLYSTFLAIFARGTQSASPNQATDSAGNTYGYIPSAPRNYDAFPSSSFSVSVARGKGGAAHTFSASIGNIGGQQDEVVIAGLELFNAQILQSSSVLEIADGTQATLTSGTVTTTAKALLVAIVGGNGNVNQGHVFTTPPGYTRVARVCAEGDVDPAGYIQVEVFVRLVDIKGTYRYTTQGTSNEGGMLWHLAFQSVASDLQPLDWIFQQPDPPRVHRRGQPAGETAPVPILAAAVPPLAWAPQLTEPVRSRPRAGALAEVAPVGAAGDLAADRLLAWLPTVVSPAAPRRSSSAGGETAPVLVPAAAPVTPPLAWLPVLPDVVRRAVAVARLIGGEAAPVQAIPNAPAPALPGWSPVTPSTALLRARTPAPGGEVAPTLAIPNPPAPPLSWAPTFPHTAARPRAAVIVGGMSAPDATIANTRPPTPPSWSTAFARLVEDVDRLAFEDLGGVTFTYQPAAGGAFPVTGIFDELYLLALNNTEAGVETVVPAVFVRLSDLPVDPEYDDPVLLIGAARYRVIERKPDGIGGIVLALRLVV